MSTAASGGSTPHPFPRIDFGTHSFIVKGLSLTKGMGSGKALASAAFSVGGFEWMVVVYPEGKTPGDEYVSAFVVLASDATNVKALFSIELYDMSGKGNHRHFCPWNRSNANAHSTPFVFDHKGIKWGYQRLIRRDELEGSDYLRDDYLRVDCSVGVGYYVSQSERIPYVLHIPTYDVDAHYCGLLLDNNEPSDIVFIVAGERFKAHRDVFVMRSPKFYDECMLGREDINGEIVVNDMDPKVFEAFLCYVYRDRLVADEMLLSSTSCSSTRPRHWVVTELLAAAVKFDLRILRMMCESFLSKRIEFGTYFDIHTAAINCKAEKLKLVCGSFRIDVLRMMSFRKPEFRHPWFSCNQDDILPDGPNSVWVEFPECRATSSKCSVRLVWGPLSEDANYHLLLVPIKRQEGCA